MKENKKKKQKKKQEEALLFVSCCSISKKFEVGRQSLGVGFFL